MFPSLISHLNRTHNIKLDNVLVCDTHSRHVVTVSRTFYTGSEYISTLFRQEVTEN